MKLTVGPDGDTLESRGLRGALPGDGSWRLRGVAGVYRESHIVHPGAGETIPLR